MEMSEQLALFLHSQNFGVFDKAGLAGNIFINTIPDQPDEAIAVFTTGGPPGDPKNQYRIVNIQLWIRTVPHDPLAGETKATKIIDALNGFNSDYFTAGGHYIVDVSAIQSAPNNMGRDQNNRFEYSQNFTIEYLI